MLVPEGVKSKFATPCVTIRTETRFPGHWIVTVAVSKRGMPPTDTVDGKMNAGWASARTSGQRRTKQLTKRKLLNVEPAAVRTRLKVLDWPTLCPQSGATVISRKPSACWYGLCSSHFIISRISIMSLARDRQHRCGCNRSSDLSAETQRSRGGR